MEKLTSLRGRTLATAAVVALLVQVTNLALAVELTNRSNASIGEYLHTKIFGDYGPVSVITGKPAPRYVNGRRVLPKEGWLSAPMRGAASNAHGGDAATGGIQSRPFTRLTIQNLTLDVPHGEWNQRVLRENQGKGLYLYRTNPKIVVALAAHRVGVEAQQTNLTLLATSQGRIARMAKAVVLPEVQELSAPGLDGLTYQAVSTPGDGREVLYSTWLAAQNGYTYEMAVYGDAEHGQLIEETTQQFVSRMRVQAPESIARGGMQPSNARHWK
jgi:hypothetical protein